MAGMTDLVILIVVGIIAIKFGPQLLEQLQNAGAGAGAQDQNAQDQQVADDQQVNDVSNLTDAINNLQNQIANRQQQPIIINNQRQQRNRQRIKVKNRNFGCQCKGRQCCFNGIKCNGQPARDCTTAVSNKVADKNRACAGTRQRFLNRNPCQSNAGYSDWGHGRGHHRGHHFGRDDQPIFGRHYPTGPIGMPGAAGGVGANGPDNIIFGQHYETNAGYAYGDKGQIVSLDALQVTVA